MRNFCWGGATAVRRATFERLNMREKWRGALSDDFALTHALHADGLTIYFVPQCLTTSHEDCTWRELVEFTTRQIKITRVYAPKLWQIVLFSNLLFALVFYGGWLWLAARAWHGEAVGVWGLSLLAVYALGSLKASWRWQAVRFLLGREIGSGRWAHLWLWPLTSLLYIYNGLAAAFSRRIVWRGIAYRLDTPQTTVIEGR